MIGENVTIVVMYPHEGLKVTIVEPDQNTLVMDVTGYESNTYKIFSYRFDKSGEYLIRLMGPKDRQYDYKKIDIKSRDIFVLPPLPEITEETVKSLLIPLIVLVMIGILALRRRTKIVADEYSIRGLIQQGELDHYDKVYTTYEIANRFPNIDNLAVIELNDSELDKALKIVDKFSISFDEAKVLVVCNKLRAKQVFLREDIPPEIDRVIKGVHVMIRELIVDEEYEQIRKEIDSKEGPTGLRKKIKTMQDKIIRR